VGHHPGGGPPQANSDADHSAFCRQPDYFADTLDGAKQSTALAPMIVRAVVKALRYEDRKQVQQERDETQRTPRPQVTSSSLLVGWKPVLCLDLKMDQVNRIYTIGHRGTCRYRRLRENSEPHPVSSIAIAVARKSSVNRQ
jgi:hypothetical protein